MFLLAVGGCGGARTDGARHRDHFWGKALAVDALVREGHTALLAQTTQTKCLFFLLFPTSMLCLEAKMCLLFHGQQAEKVMTACV